MQEVVEDKPRFMVFCLLLQERLYLVAHLGHGLRSLIPTDGYFYDALIVQKNCLYHSYNILKKQKARVQNLSLLL